MREPRPPPRQPSPSTLARADSEDEFDRQHSGTDVHHHEKLPGLELANDDATAIVYSFFQVFQHRLSMRRVVSGHRRYFQRTSCRDCLRLTGSTKDRSYDEGGTIALSVSKA